jgi:hypothetical protein
VILVLAIIVRPRRAELDIWCCWRSPECKESILPCPHQAGAIAVHGHQSRRHGADVKVILPRGRLDGGSSGELETTARVCRQGVAHILDCGLVLREIAEPSI